MSDPIQGQPRDDGTDEPLVRRFAVAVTLALPKPDATNIITHLYDVSASGHAEAVGLAVMEANRDHPTHMIFSTAYKDFTPNKRATGADEGGVQ